MDFLEELILHAVREHPLGLALVSGELERFAHTLNSRMLTALERIKAAVEDDSLSDFACVEEVVCALEEMGSNGGFRHDA